MLRTRKSALLVSLVALAAILVANAVLGPLAAGVIDYHHSGAMTARTMGLDFVALVVVAPVALFAAWLVHRERLGGPVLAFLPGTFAAYMAPQYVLGPDYAGLPGNSEQFFLLHLHLFLVGIAVVLLAWQHVDRLHLLPDTRASDVRRIWVMVVAALLVLARWVPVLPEIFAAAPTHPAFDGNPTAFLLVAMLDLAIVVPATLTAAFGLWCGAVWGRAATYAMIGSYAIGTVSTAAMSVAMVMTNHPARSLPEAAGLGLLALGSVLVTLALYHPLGIHREAVVPEAWTWEYRTLS